MRTAIAKIGGTPPENIPPAESIENVEKTVEKEKTKEGIAKLASRRKFDDRKAESVFRKST